ncbi:MAG: hypothetical protein GY754_38820 [bacterium]|nr:hypothetical protein [bacterium]
MSRIDISITEKESGEWIVNRGFCRGTHLSYFCKNCKDEQVRDFDVDVTWSVDLTKQNFSEFIKSIEYTISYLESLDENERNKLFKLYRKDNFYQFIEDLKESLHYLMNFEKDHDLDKYEIDIL